MTIKVAGHKETYAITSTEFEEWLTGEFFKVHHTPPDPKSLREALLTLRAKARFEGKKIEVYLRVAMHRQCIYIDLGDETWEAVKISTEGFTIVRPPVKFRRTQGMLSLPRPIKGGSIEELKQFINLANEDDWVLLVGFILGAWNPRGPYPILELTGEPGSAKSTAARVIRGLIDPNASPLRSLPKSERDVVISANNSWCQVFDNVSYLDQHMSDVLCRLSSGGGFSTRTLYKDEDETIFEVQRPVIITALSDVVVRGDLLDRTMVIELPVLAGSRITENDLFSRFEEARPRILGAIYEAIAGALRAKRPEGEWPRLADFAVWVTKAEESLGWTPKRFMQVYERNREETRNVVAELNPVVQLVQELADAGEWHGIASDLLSEFIERAGERNPPLIGLPLSPGRLSFVLREMAPHLRARGIEINHDRRGHAGMRMIHIHKSAVSTVSTVSEAA